ncbi:10827_t:CDS:2, partial [Ambispora gerdemannii]
MERERESTEPNSGDSFNKRTALTGAEKKQLCEKKWDFPSIKGRELAKDFGISEQAVSKILKRSRYWLSLEAESTAAKFKHDRKSNYPEIEEAMLIWVDQAIAREFTIQEILANYRRLLCQDRIEAYDALTPENPMPSPLTIQNAIEFSAAAWNSVTETTIHFTVDHTETESELANLIFQMPQVSDPLSVMEYIQIDNQVASEEQMTDEEIVKFVTGEEAQEPENHKELSIPITITDALEGLGK